MNSFILSLFCTVFTQDGTVLAQVQEKSASKIQTSIVQQEPTVSSFNVNKISDIKTFWSLTKLGGSISFAIFLVLALGIFLITLQLYELTVDKFKGRALLALDYRQHSLSEISGLVQNSPTNLTARLYSILLSIFHSTGNTRDFHDEIANYIQLQQDRFTTFKSRLTFLSDTAGALGLLGTVWGMFITFFGGNLDSQRILNGMGLALVTTLIGLVVSIILNFFSTEVFSTFNKRLDLISSKADEFRLWLMAIVHHRNKKSNNSQGSGGEPTRKAQTEPKHFQTEINESILDSLSLKAISDFKQDGFIGHALPEPISIVVETNRGKRAVGVPIRFEVSEGDGILANKNNVACVKTNKKGLAAMQWTLGHQVAPQKLKVTIANKKKGALEFVSFAKPYISSDLNLNVMDFQNKTSKKELYS